MKLIRTLVLAAAGSLLMLGAQGDTVSVQGVKLEDTIKMQGSRLQLNGAGTRFKAIFKVYVAGLYLCKKATTPDEVVNQPGPKRLAVTMLRTIDSKDLGKLLNRGMEDSMDKAVMSKLVPGLIRMGEMFAAQKPLVAGDQFRIEWVPNVGSVITVKGVVHGEPFKEAEFFKALMMIWLSPVPADNLLKDALLGGK
jgi:hypothetical protein